MAAAAARRSSDHPVPGHSPRQTARRPFLRRAFFGDHRSRRTGSPRSRTSPSQAHSRPRGKQCAKSESVDSAGTHHPPAGRGGTPRPEARGCRAGRSRPGPAGTEPARHRRNPRRRGERAVVHASGTPGGVTGEQPPRNGPGQTGPVPPVPDLTAGQRRARRAHERRREVSCLATSRLFGTERLTACAPDTAGQRACWVLRTRAVRAIRAGHRRRRTRAIRNSCLPGACSSWPHAVSPHGLSPPDQRPVFRVLHYLTQRLTLTSSRHSTGRLPLQSSATSTRSPPQVRRDLTSRAIRDLR
ncbi:hypothetical protein SAMN05660733_05797 [Lentzea albidocapillata]|uniref:Uncharacterized protein n=1 Tax=Lentzea albidocapillata TaxID=40571 RepID=A0A1W2FEQ6_9PSEU|nr:hypothetical protein SAMN05660733_05797 [Lentzea albidocapillata]